MPCQPANYLALFLTVLCFQCGIVTAETAPPSAPPDNQYIPFFSEKADDTRKAIKAMVDHIAYGKIETICPATGDSDCDQARTRLLDFCNTNTSSPACAAKETGYLVEVLTSAHAGGTELMPDTLYGLYLNPFMFVPATELPQKGDMVQYTFVSTPLGLAQTSPETDGRFLKIMCRNHERNETCTTDGIDPLVASATWILTYTTEVSTQCNGWDSRNIKQLAGWHNGYMHKDFISDLTSSSQDQTSP